MVPPASRRLNPFFPAAFTKRTHEFCIFGNLHAHTRSSSFCKAPMAKLITAWLILSSVSLLIGFLWLQPELNTEAGGAAAGKLAVLLGLVGAFGLLFAYLLARRWSQRLKRLETFVEALPSAELELPEDG